MKKEDIEEKEDLQTPATEQKEEKHAEPKLWGSLFTEGESNEQEHGLKESLRGVSIDSKWMFKQLPLLLTITAGFMVMVGGRYQAQQEMIERARLEEETKDWKIRYITQHSELTRMMRQSQIEERLKQAGDSTLIQRPEKPYIIYKED